LQNLDNIEINDVKDEWIHQHFNISFEVLVASIFTILQEGGPP